MGGLTLKAADADRMFGESCQRLMQALEGVHDILD